MTIQVDIAEKLTEGEKIGEIVQVENRTGEYVYTDYHIRPEGSKMILKVGFPTNISVDGNGNALSLHAKFLKKMGVQLFGQIDEQSLLTRKVRFSVMLEQSKKDGNEYAKIVRETVRPV